MAQEEGGARADSLAQAEAAHRDSLAREERLRVQAAAMASSRATLVAPIYFPYDESVLTPDARRALDLKLPLLGETADLRLLIGGNADERGSDEYNLSLGQRRATAVLKYLTDHGVPIGRLGTVSYGEERPVCEVKEESCWSRNRRAEFDFVASVNRR